jgi:hypothetical protein
MIVDPIERIEFKLKQPGLRRFASTQASVELPLEIEDEALTQAYLERQSYRQFQQYPLELQRFSQFLSCLRQLKLGIYRYRNICILLRAIFIRCRLMC